MAEFAGYDEIFEKIVSLHDHKGVLTVTWSRNPTGREYGSVNVAWRSDICDGDSSHVEHELLLQPTREERT